MRWLLPFACACHQPLAYDVATGPRDWAAHPALVDLADRELYAVSDVHGAADRLVALLQGNGLIDASHAWSGGDATLVVVGDLIDKGPDSLDVVDLLRGLGDHAVVTIGNHEAEFFADPTNDKAEASDGVDPQLSADGIDLVAFASGAEPRGAWLRTLPFGARIGDWFFAHAGQTGGRTFDALAADLAAAFDADDFRGDAFVGDDSLLEARDWYGDSIAASLTALGVAHVVFGHDPNALGPRGAIAQSGALIRIDCGMSPDVGDSDGKLLHVVGGVATQLDPSGAAVSLP